MALRTLSSLPISVGTGMAIETLVRTPLTKYSSFLINVTTLIRNAIEAFEKDAQITVDDVFEATEEDMRGIAEAFAVTVGSHHITLIYYYPSYSGLSSMFPLANLKEPKTDLQIKEKKLIDKVGEKIKDKYAKIITKNNVTIPDFKGEAIIITHHPVDLATSKSYTRLHLLESHTGTLKSHESFGTKLTGGKELFNMPLNKLTIQIFGDNAVDFYAVKSFKVKNEIKRLADEANWSTGTTPSFVIATVKSLPPSPDKDILLKMI